MKGKNSALFPAALLCLAAIAAAVVPGGGAGAAGLRWSKNNVFKFRYENLREYRNLRDYENIAVTNGYEAPLSNTNSWLVSWGIDVGEDYQIDSAFVNFEKTNAGSYVVMKLRDGENDALIREQRFDKLGKMVLTNVFNTNVCLSLEIVGNDVRVYSYGLVRKELVVIAGDDVQLDPEKYFYEEGTADRLTVRFRLHFPAEIDVILFDKNGRIIQYLARNRYFSEGDNTLAWRPSEEMGAGLVSGTYLVYFNFGVPNGKKYEIIKKFLFINK